MNSTFHSNLPTNWLLNSLLVFTVSYTISKFDRIIMWYTIYNIASNFGGTAELYFI